jgi:cytochrome c553
MASGSPKRRAGCHGALGISKTQEVPHLAGQRPAYLYPSSGLSGAQTVMANTVKPLNDSALAKVAAYYASLEPAHRRQAQNRRLRGRPGPGRKAAAGLRRGDTGINKTRYC